MFDHAQSPRLGQPTPVENPGVQLVTQESLPEVAYRGQMVFALDLEILQVFDGVAWQPVGGGGEGGSQTFVGPTPPVADDVGDLWMNTVDYQLYVWDGTEWQPVNNTQQAVFSRLSLMLARALYEHFGVTDPHRVIYYDTVAPPGATGDLWCNVTTNQVYVYSAGWTLLVNTTLADAVQAAGVARSVLDGTIEVYCDVVAPTGLGPLDIGDLWFVTSEGNLIRGWTGSTWANLQLTGDDLGPGSVGGVHLEPDSVDGGFHIIDGSIVTEKIEDGAITNDKVGDFALAVTKLVSLDHHIY